MPTSPRLPARLVGAATLSLAGVLTLAACNDSTAPSHAPTLTPRVAMCCGGVPTWSASELPLPPGSWVQSDAAASNDSNIVVGHLVDATGFQRPVRWVNGVPYLAVLPLSDHSTFILGVNNAGEMVGGGQLMTPPYLGVRKPVRWAQGIVTFLPTLGFDGYARDINMSRVSVGESRSGAAIKRHAVKWSANGAITDLHPAGASTSVAYGINDAGDIVGRADFPNGAHAWKWKANGTQVDLGLTKNYAAEEINNLGEAVGTIPSQTGYVATLWTSAGTSTLLPGVPAPSLGTGISNAHRVIGTTAATGVSSPFTAKANSFTILPSLATWSSVQPQDVNRCGHIVGRAFTPAGYRAVRWMRSECDA